MTKIALLSKHESARNNFGAALTTAVGFGISFAILSFSIHLLWPQRRRRGGFVTLGYACTLLLCSTIWYIMSANTNERLIVEAAYTKVTGLYCSHTNIAANVFGQFNFYLSDALLVYRTFIIWQGSYLAIAPLVLLYLAYFGVGLALLTTCAQAPYGPLKAFPLTTALNLPVAWYSLTVALNVLTTLLIAGRLISHALQMRRAGVRAPESISATGVFVESAAAYAIVGLVYIWSYHAQDAAQSPLGALFSVSNLICPGLIVLRFALGSSYSPHVTDVHNTNATISFVRPGRHAYGHGVTTGATSTTAGRRSNVSTGSSKDSGAAEAQLEK